MIPAPIQSALHAAGIQASRIEWLWWVMLGVCTAVYVIVIAALVMAVRRGLAGDGTRSSVTLTRAVTAGSLVTAAVLLVLLVASVSTGRALASLASPEPLSIQITGHQWWWEVEYVHSLPSMRATTANELHLPVGRPVALTLKSADVIHSFWVPNLHGKMDLVPGRANTLWLRADSPGVFRGQCAEFCGLQHAHMALAVTVEDNDAFERWWAAQRQPAAPPSNAEQQRGLAVVERGPCAMCHRIAGTSAGARYGPDLTHFGSRSTIAAGTLPNTREHLERWLSNPQRIKPGAKMPMLGLSPDDVRAVAAYLETLR